MKTITLSTHSSTSALYLALVAAAGFYIGALSQPVYAQSAALASADTSSSDSTSVSGDESSSSAHSGKPPAGGSPNGERRGPPGGGARACDADLQKFCSDVEHGPAAWECLSKHESEVTAACKTDMTNLKNHPHHRQ